MTASTLACPLQATDSPGGRASRQTTPIRQKAYRMLWQVASFTTPVSTKALVKRHSKVDKIVNNFHGQTRSNFMVKHTFFWPKQIFFCGQFSWFNKMSWSISIPFQILCSKPIPFQRQNFMLNPIPFERQNFMVKPVPFQQQTFHGQPQRLAPPPA